MSGEDAPRPCLENPIVPEIKANKQKSNSSARMARQKLKPCALMLPSDSDDE